MADPKETKNVQQTEKGEAQVGAGAKTVKRKALRPFTQHVGGGAAASIQAQAGQTVEVPEDQVEALEEGGFIEREGGAKAQAQASHDEDEDEGTKAKGAASKPAAGAKR